MNQIIHEQMAFVSKKLSDKSSAYYGTLYFRKYIHHTLHQMDNLFDFENICFFISYHSLHKVVLTTKILSH